MPGAVNHRYKETPCTESAGFSNLLHKAFPDFMYYQKYAFPSCKSTPIILASLGNDAGIYGAARMVIKD